MFSDDDDNFLKNSLDKTYLDDKNRKETMSDGSVEANKDIGKQTNSEWSQDSYSNDPNWSMTQPYSSPNKPSEPVINGYKSDDTSSPSSPVKITPPSSSTVTADQKALIKARQRRFASSMAFRRKPSQDFTRPATRPLSASSGSIAHNPNSPFANSSGVSVSSPLSEPSSPPPASPQATQSPPSSPSPSPSPSPPPRPTHRTYISSKSISRSQTQVPVPQIIRRPAAPSKKLPIISSRLAGNNPTHSSPLSSSPPTSQVPKPNPVSPELPASARLLDKPTKTKQRKPRNKKNEKKQSKPKKVEVEQPPKPLPFYAQPPQQPLTKNDDRISTLSSSPSPAPSSPPPPSPKPSPKPPPRRPIIRGRVPTKNTIFKSFNSENVSNEVDSDSDDEIDKCVPPKTPYGGFHEEDSEKEEEPANTNPVTQTPSPRPPPLDLTYTEMETRHSVATPGAEWISPMTNELPSHHFPTTKRQTRKDNNPVRIQEPVPESPVHSPSPSPPPIPSNFTPVVPKPRRPYPIPRRPVPRKNIQNITRYEKMPTSSDDEPSPPIQYRSPSPYNSLPSFQESVSPEAIKPSLQPSLPKTRKEIAPSKHYSRPLSPDKSNPSSPKHLLPPSLHEPKKMDEVIEPHPIVRKKTSVNRKTMKSPAFIKDDDSSSANESDLLIKDIRVPESSPIVKKKSSTNKKPVNKAPAIANNNDSSSDNNEIDLLEKKIEEVPKQKKKASINKKPANVPATVNNNDSSSDDEIDLLKKRMEEVPAKPKKVSTKQKPAKTPAVINDNDTSSDDEIDLLKKRIEVPKPKKVSANKKPAKTPAIINNNDASSDDEIDLLKKRIEKKPKSKKKVSANKKPAKTPAIIDNDSSHSDDENDILKKRIEEVTESHPTDKKVEKKITKTPPALLNNHDSSSEDEIDLLKKRIVETPAVKKKASVNKKPKTPAINDSSSDDEIDLLKKRIEEISEFQPIVKDKSSVNKKTIKRPAINDDDDSDEDNEIVRPPKKKLKFAKAEFQIGISTPEKNVDATATKERAPVKKSKEKSSKKESPRNIEILKSDKKKKKDKKKSASPIKQPHTETFDQKNSKIVPVPQYTKDHHSSFKGERKDKPVHKLPGQQKSNDITIARAEKQKHSVEPTNEIEKPQTKKVKKSTKSVSPLATKTKKESTAKPVKTTAKKNKTDPPPVMDWFSAVLASEVQKKQVSRRPPVKPSSVTEHSRTKDPKSSSNTPNKDVVLAAKFPHKRKLVPASEVLSSSHPKRPASASANRVHKKPFT